MKDADCATRIDYMVLNIVKYTLPHQSRVFVLSVLLCDGEYVSNDDHRSLTDQAPFYKLTCSHFISADNIEPILLRTLNLFF